MSIRVYRIRWWGVAAVVLALGCLMALGYCWRQEQEAAMARSDDPARKLELKREVADRQAMYLLYGVGALCVVWGVVAAARRRRRGPAVDVQPEVSVSVKDGVMTVRGQFRRVEVTTMFGDMVHSTTRPVSDLNVEHGRFIIHLTTSEGHFHRLLNIDNYSESRRGPDRWSTTM